MMEESTILIEELSPIPDPKPNGFRMVLSAIPRFIHSRVFRKFMYWLSTAALGIFVLLSKLGLTHVMKYFIASSQIPIELAMLYTQLKKMHDQHSSWFQIIGIAVLGLVPIAFYILYDIYNWGSQNPAVVAAANALPFVFAGLMAAMAIVNSIKLFAALRNYRKDYRHGVPMSPLEKFRLANKIIKTAGTIIMASLLVPASLFPPLALPLFGVMVFAFMAIVASKIVKQVYERKTWSWIILVLKGEDPYLKLLGTQERVNIFNDLVAIEKLPENKMKFKDKIIKTFSREETTDKESVKMLKMALRDKCKVASVEEKQKLLAIYDLLKSRRGRQRYDEHLNPPEPGRFAKWWMKVKIKMKIKLGPQNIKENKEQYKPLPVYSSNDEEKSGMMSKQSGNVLRGVGGASSKLLGTHPPFGHLLSHTREGNRK